MQSRQIRQLPSSSPLHEQQHEHVASILGAAIEISLNDTQHFQSNVRANDGIDARESRSTYNCYTRFFEEKDSSGLLACDNLRPRRKPPKERHHLAIGLAIMDELGDEEHDVDEEEGECRAAEYKINQA